MCTESSKCTEMGLVSKASVALCTPTRCPISNLYKLFETLEVPMCEFAESAQLCYKSAREKDQIPAYSLCYGFMPCYVSFNPTLFLRIYLRKVSTSVLAD